jgi:hypothetical protein
MHGVETPLSRMFNRLLFLSDDKEDIGEDPDKEDIAEAFQRLNSGVLEKKT